MKAKKHGPGAAIAVSAGQIYRVPRTGIPARHVRIQRVIGSKSHQPIVYYREVTRTGNAKPGGSIRTFLHWDGERWGMRPGFELVTP